MMPPCVIPQGEVFISYFREDSPRVDRLEAALRAAGLDVWRDRAACTIQLARCGVAVAHKASN
jgi:hypothetical protein